MKESKGFKMLMVYSKLSFHKDILKNYLRPLGADSLGFLESYFGLRMFRYPGLEMLNLSEVEMVYLVQPVMNTSYRAYPALRGYHSFWEPFRKIPLNPPFANGDFGGYAPSSVEEGLNSEEKLSAYPYVEGQVEGLLLETRKKAISGKSTNLIKSFFPIYTHKYIPAFMESSFYKGVRANSSVFKQTFKLEQDRIHLDSETSSAARTAKSEIFTKREEIFFGRGKFDLTTPKRVAILDHISFPALKESKVADVEFKMQHRRPAFFSGNTFINGTKDDLNKRDRKIASHLPEQRSPFFLQRSTKIYHGRPPEAQPILHFGRPSLRMHKFTSSTMHHSFRPPLPNFKSSLKSQKYQNSSLSLQLLRSEIKQIRPKSMRLPDEVNSSTILSDTQHNTSFSPRLIFADRHYNSSRSFEVMKVKEDTNSKEGVKKSYPIGLESSGLTAPAQHSVNYELIADRVYDIIENRLRIEKERE